MAIKKTAKKDVVPKKKAVKPKKVIKKEKKPNLKYFFLSECEKNKNIIVMDISADSAFIVKKKVEMVRKELCAGTMNPIEILEEMTFFHCFIVRWKNKKSPKHSMMETLEKKGFPIYQAEIEYDIVEAIKNA